MKDLHLQRFAIPILILFIISRIVESNGNQTEPNSDGHTLHFLTDMLLQWRTTRKRSQEARVELSLPVVLSGTFCFLAASISSAGGIGGGGLFIPILKIVAGLDLKTASSFSAFMVTGGSIANVLYNLLTTTSSKFGDKNSNTMIDYDIALLSEPCMLLGVSAGVVLNLVFPEWLITILFAAFLAWSTFKTCRNGVLYWKMESEMLNQNGLGRFEHGGNGKLEGVKVPLLVLERDGPDGGLRRCPWMKLWVLLMVWFCFFVLSLLRGNRYGKGIIEMEACGVGYWTLSLLQIPMAILFTLWILCREQKKTSQVANQQEIADSTSNGLPNKLIFPLMALLAGMLGGVFGIGGGMLISPLLLEVGVIPEVTAATCSFMVCFSSTMSAFQYLLIGMEHTGTALLFSCICFLASLIGLALVQRAIHKHGRPSVIVFSIGTVMALSAIMMTSFGAIDVWNDYISGSYMGFTQPC